MPDRQFVLRDPAGGSALLHDFQLRGPSATYHTGAAALTGTGSQTVAGVRIRLGAAALTGAGSQAVAGAATRFAAAALTGTGSTVVAGGVLRTGAAALAGVGTQTAAGIVFTSGAAALTGAGTQTVAGTYLRVGVAALSGTGTQTAAGIRIRLGASALTGAGAVVFLLLPPRNLVGIPVGTTRIDLTWDESLGAETYDLERDGLIIAGDIAETEFSDTGLVADTEYIYRVRAARAA